MAGDEGRAEMARKESAGRVQGIEDEEAGVKIGGLPSEAPPFMDLDCVNQVATLVGSQVSERRWQEKILSLGRPGNRGGKRQEIAM